MGGTPQLLLSRLDRPEKLRDWQIKRHLCARKGHACAAALPSIPHELQFTFAFEAFDCDGDGGFADGDAMEGDGFLGGFDIACVTGAKVFPLIMARR